MNVQFILQEKRCIEDLLKLNEIEDETVLTTQKVSEGEVLVSHGKLMGTAEPTLDGVDIVAMRREKQLNMEEREMLIRFVSVNEIEDALKSIRDLKAPCVPMC